MNLESCICFMKYDLDDFSYIKDNISKLFGQEIDVYMSSIGQTITEYLVNFQLFIELMKEYDLRWLSQVKEFKGYLIIKIIIYGWIRWI